FVVSILNLCFFILSSTLFVTYFYSRHFVINADYRRISPYSPVLSQFDLEPVTKKINGSF
ncbi:hypothetical protein CC80DRAFT_363413, partial [Byssothecium circinans]